MWIKECSTNTQWQLVVCTAHYVHVLLGKKKKKVRQGVQKTIRWKKKEDLSIILYLQACSHAGHVNIGSGIRCELRQGYRSIMYFSQQRTSTLDLGKVFSLLFGSLLAFIIKIPKHAWKGREQKHWFWFSHIQSPGQIVHCWYFHILLPATILPWKGN